MMERFLHTSRWCTLWFLAGTAVGAYNAYSFEHGTLKHLESLVFDRGYCGDWDVDHNRHVYPCRDAAVAMDLQAKAVEYDRETAAILKDLQAKPAGAKGRPKP